MYLTATTLCGQLLAKGYRDFGVCPILRNVVFAEDGYHRACVCAQVYSSCCYLLAMEKVASGVRRSHQIVLEDEPSPDQHS